MDEHGFRSDPPAANEIHQLPKDSGRRRNKLLPVLMTLLAVAGGAMLLVVTFIPLDVLPLCKISFTASGRLDVGILGSCSSSSNSRKGQVCQRRMGLDLDHTELGQSQQDVLQDSVVVQLTYVFIFVPISGGLAFVSVALAALGHFFKSSCFVFFGEGNILAFAFMTLSGLAGLSGSSIVLAFLLYANVHLKGAALHLEVPALVLTFAGSILTFTAFLIALLLFNRSYSSGVIEAGDLDPFDEQHTETDFWTDGERAERNEQLLQAQEQAEKNALRSMKDNDLKQMNAFLLKGRHHTPVFEPALDHPRTPRLQKTPRAAPKSGNYAASWQRPTPRFDNVPLPPAPTPRLSRPSRRNTANLGPEEEQEMLDDVRPLELYKAKTPRKGFEPPPPAPTSSRYSQNTGYLQSIAPSAADVSQMPSVEEARNNKANALFEKQKQKHQSVAPSSVYSQI